MVQLFADVSCSLLNGVCRSCCISRLFNCSQAIWLPVSHTTSAILRNADKSVRRLSFTLCSD